MSTLQNFYNIAKKNNIITGIILFEIIAVVLFFIFPYRVIFYYGELGVLCGAIIGMIFAYRYRSPIQKTSKIALYYIIIGGIVISFTLSIIEWVTTISTYGINSIVFLSLFVSNLIMVFVYTVIVGIFIAYYYSSH